MELVIESTYKWWTKLFLKKFCQKCEKQRKGKTWRAEEKVEIYCEDWINFPSDQNPEKNCRYSDSPGCFLFTECCLEITTATKTKNRLFALHSIFICYNYGLRHGIWFWFYLNVERTTNKQKLRECTLNCCSWFCLCVQMTLTETREK